MSIEQPDNLPATPSVHPDNEVLVEVEHLYFNRGENVVLEDLNFTVYESDFVGIIGPNGGGKTTLMKLLLGLLKPTSGRVEVFGTPAWQLGRKRLMVGYLPQQARANWDFPATVLDVVLMGAYGKVGLGRRVNRTLVERGRYLLEEVGLSALAERPIGKLSGGQQQRALIARALMNEPRLLLLDEPTAGLDSAAQEDFFQLLLRLRTERQLTLLMVSHDLGLLTEYADYLVCLNKRMHWHGKPELLSEQVIEDIYACELGFYFERHRQHQERYHSGS